LIYQDKASCSCRGLLSFRWAKIHSWKLP
jgi:hypothetical protein